MAGEVVKNCFVGVGNGRVDWPVRVRVVEVKRMKEDEPATFRLKLSDDVSTISAFYTVKSPSETQSVIQLQSQLLVISKAKILPGARPSLNLRAFSVLPAAPPPVLQSDTEQMQVETDSATNARTFNEWTVRCPCSRFLHAQTEPLKESSGGVLVPLTAAMLLSRDIQFNRDMSFSSVTCSSCGSVTGKYVHSASGRHRSAISHAIVSPGLVNYEKAVTGEKPATVQTPVEQKVVIEPCVDWVILQKVEKLREETKRAKGVRERMEERLVDVYARLSNLGFS